MGTIDGLLEGPRTDPTLREALATGGVGVWSWDLASGFFSADATARRLWRLPSSGRISIDAILGAVHPADVERVRSIGAAARLGEEANAIFRVRHPGGEVRWTRVRGRIEAGSNNRRLVGVSIDVTERMRSETALTATERKLQSAQELGGVHAFEWDARGACIAASRGYNALLGLSPDEPEHLAAFLERVHPDDRTRIEEEQHRLLESPGPYEWEFRIVPPDGGVRWILSRGEGVQDEDGAPAGIAGVVMDITSRKEVEDELRRSRREARARFRELKALYNNAPIGLALLDRDLRVVRVNAALAAINGLPAEEHVGRDVFEVIPDLRRTAEPLLQKVIETGEAIANVQFEGEAPLSPGSKRIWIDHFYPVADDFGTIVGVGIVCEEVTERRQIEASRDLLSRELSHRIKNLFAVVSSLISLSARGDGNAERFARLVRGRIEALGHAHDYVRPAAWGGGPGEQTRTLHGLLAMLLGAYRDEADAVRIAVAGADVAIGSTAATSLALAIHELATNALKYGALSTPGGTVEIACAEQGEDFLILWSERGGPPLDGPPEKEGFGSLLARRSVTSDLGGSLDAEWVRSGLRIRLLLPRERLAR